VNSPANDCIIPRGTVIHDGQCTPGVQASPTLGCSFAAGSSPDRAGIAMFGVLLLAAGEGPRARAGHRGRRARPPPSGSSSGVSA
jgi:hypothetical protein